MLDITARSNIGDFAKVFERTLQSQIPFATSLALNRVAELALPALRANMNVVFDRPKPYTLNSLFIKKSNKTNLTVVIFHSSKIAPYLQPEIKGGARDLKPFEIPLGRYVLVPTNNVPKDAYGGVSKAYIAKVLRLATDTSISNKTREYVLVKPGQASKLEPGIYQRVNGKIKALFLFKSKARYAARYDMLGVVERVAKAEFNKQFVAQLDYALSTARLKF